MNEKIQSSNVNNTTTFQEVRRTALVRRRSDGSLLEPRYANAERHIKIYISNEDQQ